MAGKNRLAAWGAAALFAMGGAGIASAQDMGDSSYFYGEKDWSIGLDVGAYYASMSANASIDGDATTAPTSLDFESDLGADGTDLGLNIGGYAAWGDHMVTLDYFGLTYSGGTTLTSAVGFGDNTYAIGTSVNAETELSVVDVLYTYKFYNGDPRWYVGAELGFSYISIKESLSGGGVSDSASASAPIPMLGLRAEGFVWDRYVSLSGELHGLTLGSSGSAFEMTLKVNGYITENVGAYVGFKYFTLGVNKDNVDADFSTSGVIFGAELRF